MRSRSIATVCCGLSRVLERSRVIHARTGTSCLRSSVALIAIAIASLAHAAPPASAVLSISDPLLTADYELSTATLDFGDLSFDATPSRTFCIRNTGQVTIQIQGSLSIVPAAGTTMGEFSIAQIRRPATCEGTGTTDVTLPETLDPGQLLQVTVRANPANRTGLMLATLTVNSDLAMNPKRTLALRANSTSNIPALTPGSLIDFGAVDVQGEAASQILTITNTGSAPLSLTNFQRSAAPEFTFTLPGYTLLLSNQTVNIQVTYKPVVASPPGSEETVLLTHDIAGSLTVPTSQAIILRGRGIDRELSLAATPTFPETFRSPGDLAPVRAVTVQNLGEATLKVSAVMLGGGDAGSWQLVDAAPAAIPSGTSHDFRVRFAPLVAGLSKARLVLTNDDDKRPMASIALAGVGIDRPVRFASETIHVGYTWIGVPVTIDGALVVASTDPTHTFQIRAIELDQDSPFAIEGLSPDLDLPPLSERKLSVAFTPGRDGVFTAKARLYLDMDPLVHQEITIEGTAVFVDAHGGGGCAASGSDTRGAAGGIVLALAALLGRRRRDARRCSI